MPKITEFYKKISVCPNITSKFRNTAMFESSIKENNDSNKTYTYVHGLSMLKTIFVHIQGFMSSLRKIKFKF
jgi:hypothetical protein